MAIDVFLGGLMLICLNGQKDCPVGKLGNTAWVVKAGPQADKAKICERESTEVTHLILRFSADQFFKESGPLEDKCKTDKGITECKLYLTGATGEDHDFENICVIPNAQDSTQELDSSIQQVPRLAEIDRRFILLSTDYLKNTKWVPTQIHFPLGVIGAGPKWWKDNTIPTPWSRSDGSKDGTLPRALSDKLKVTYQGATSLKVMTCDGKPLIEITLKTFTASGDVYVLNYADNLTPARNNSYHYEDLDYLVWYYRLGIWDTYTQKCPLDAIVLSCYWVNSTYCAKNNAADSTHWPPVMGSAY